MTASHSAEGVAQSIATWTSGFSGTSDDSSTSSLVGPAIDAGSGVPGAGLASLGTQS